MGRKIFGQLQADGSAHRGELHRPREKDDRDVHPERRPQHVHDGRGKSQLRRESGEPRRNCRNQRGLVQFFLLILLW
jgi:hypothetical protein